MSELRHLQMETTNICNARCIFCPHDRFEHFETMPWSLYTKIIEDAAQYNLQSFMPMLTGEPFCDNEIMERIRFARMRMPDTTIRIFTNGSLISESDIDELAALGNIDIYVSLNGACRETRLKLMGLDDWDRVNDNIEHMFAVGLNPIVTMVAFPTLSWQEMANFSNYPYSCVIRYQSFAGENYQYKRIEPTACQRALHQMTVMVNGNVCLCCFDPFGKVVFGNLREQTISQVWGNPLHRKYLEAHKQGRGQELELCRNCTEGV